MKNLLKSKNLPILTAALGGIGLVLRRILYAVAVDQKNLLSMGHPLEILLWLVTLAAVVLIVVSVWKLDGSNRYADNFQPSLAAAAGHFAAAAGILLTVLFSRESVSGAMYNGWKVLGILSALALVLAGIGRMKGKRPLFLYHMVVCVFLVFHMLGLYQAWSSNPQLQDYAFDLFGCSALTLFAFYEAAFDVGSGKRRMHLATGLLAVYFSCVALSGSQYPLLYLAGAAWAATDLCTLTPVPKRQRPKVKGEQEK